MYILISDINVDYNLQPDKISKLIQSNFAIWVPNLLTFYVDLVESKVQSPNNVCMPKSVITHFI